MVARFIQKYWRGKANYCHYDSHDKNLTLASWTIVTWPTHILTQPFDSVPEMSGAHEKRWHEGSTLPFSRFVLLTLFFCFASYRLQSWYNDVGRLGFWQAHVWTFWREYSRWFFSHDVSPWVSWIFFSKRVEIAGSPANTSFAVGYFVTCQMGYLHLLQLKKFTRTRPLSGPGTCTY